jgi:hypothetical protein
MKLVLAATAILIGLTAHSQQKGPSQADQREKTWEINARYKYQTRLTMARALDALKNKASGTLSQRTTMAKSFNSGDVLPEFKATFEVSFKNLNGFEYTTYGFEKVNGLMNVEVQNPSGWRSYIDSPKVVEVQNRATLSIVKQLLFVTDKHQRGTHFERTKDGEWTEPTATGIRLCRLQGGESNFVECFEVMPDQKIIHQTGIGSLLSNDISLRNVPTPIQSGHDVLSLKEPVAVDGKVLITRVKHLIEVLSALQEKRPLVQEELAELDALKKLLPKKTVRK